VRRSVVRFEFLSIAAAALIFVSGVNGAAPGFAAAPRLRFATLGVSGVPFSPSVVPKARNRGRYLATPRLRFATLGVSGVAVDAGPEAVEPLQFRSWVEPKQVRLGEPFVYQLVITHPLSQRYELPVPTALGPFELLGQSRSREDAKDAATTTFKLRFSVFELGRQTLPDLEFQVAEANRVGRFVATGMEVEAISSLPRDANEKGVSLYDIKPPEDVPVRSYRLIWALLVALALIGLGYAGVKWFRRPRPVRVPTRPLEPLHVRTIAALDQLKKEDLPSRGRVREFYFRVSEILRAYLGERYGFEALECTGTELMDAIDRLRAPGLPRDELAHFVQRSDLAKFAKAEVTSAGCQSDLEFAYRLVQLTWSRPEAATGSQLTQVAGANSDSSNADRAHLP